jgi:hypothetical protein
MSCTGNGNGTTTLVWFPVIVPLSSGGRDSGLGGKKVSISFVSSFMSFPDNRKEAITRLVERTMTKATRALRRLDGVSFISVQHLREKEKDYMPESMEIQRGPSVKKTERATV